MSYGIVLYNLDDEKWREEIDGKELRRKLVWIVFSEDN